MKLEGIRFVFAAYGISFAVLVAWVWMIAAKIERLDRRADQEAADKT